MKFWIHSIAIFLALVASVKGSQIPEPVREEIEGVEMVGTTRVTVLFWELYDISLYAPDGAFDESMPFALRLQYLRDIKGRVIAEKSIEEMRKQGISEIKLAAWYGQLKSLFPDVQEGSELIGVFQEGEATRFYNRDKYIGQILDPEFGPPFSRIWLGEGEKQMELRIRLLGGKDS